MCVLECITWKGLHLLRIWHKDIPSHPKNEQCPKQNREVEVDDRPASGSSLHRCFNSFWFATALLSRECASSFFFCSLNPDIILLVSSMKIMPMVIERKPVLLQRFVINYSTQNMKWNNIHYLSAWEALRPESKRSLDMSWYEPKCKGCNCWCLWVIWKDERMWCHVNLVSARVWVTVMIMKQNWAENWEIIPLVKI